MKVGAGTYTASLPAGAMGGFAVLAFQAGDISNGMLTGFNLSNPNVPGNPLKVYVTRNSDATANYAGLAQLHADLAAYSAPVAQDLPPLRPLDIIVRSIGAPIPAYNGTDATLATAINQLTADIGGIGGHEDWIWRLAQGNNTSPPQSYSLVGRNGLTEGQTPAVDTGSSVQPTPTTPTASSFELSGQLTRDNHSLFAAQQAVNGPARDNPLPAVITSEPVPWPDSSTPGQRLALQCIGDAAELGPDPLAQYWLDPTKAEQGVGSVTLSAAQAACPAGSPPLSSTDFAAVKSELMQETGWVNNVYGYFNDLASPFTGNAGLKSYADVATITTQIKNDFKIPDSQHTGLDGLSVTGELIGASATAAEVENPLADVIAYVFYLASEFTEGSSGTSQGPSVFAQRDTVSATGANIGAALAGQLQSVADSYTQLAQITVSDYQRLKLVATYGGCAAGSPGCTPGWQYSVTGRNSASELLELNAKRTAWAGLLPAVFPYVLHTTSNPGDFNGTFLGPQDQISGIGCDFTPQFFYVPNPIVNVAKPTFMTYGLFGSPNTQPFLVFSATNFPGESNGAPNNNFPSNTLLDDPTHKVQAPFGPLNPSGNPDNLNYGLGMDEYQFMIDHWAPSHRPQWVGCTG
jgi:hypothetical protein